LEASYRTAKFVDNVCVYAFPQRAKPIAVVVPDEKAVRAFVTKSAAFDGNTDFTEIVKDQGVRDVVKKDMLEAGKVSGLRGIELISDVILSAEQWTPENVSQTFACI
jgi:long-chain acyl-CoA synthetase